MNVKRGIREVACFIPKDPSYRIIKSKEAKRKPGNLQSVSGVTGKYPNITIMTKPFRSRD